MHRPLQRDARIVIDGLRKPVRDWRRSNLRLQGERNEKADSGDGSERTKEPVCHGHPENDPVKRFHDKAWTFRAGVRRILTMRW
jgi:hypothetical protein